MFRYERPQAGRYREHYQFGAEALGSDDPMVDAEVIAMLGQVYDELEIGDLTLAINSMGDATCRPAYVELLREFLQGHAEELCGECRERIDTNPLRTFDCKVESCRAVLDAAPRIVDHLCAPCRQHFDAVLELLRRVGLAARARLSPGARPRLLHAHHLRVPVQRPRLRPEHRSAAAGATTAWSS